MSGITEEKNGGRETVLQYGSVRVGLSEEGCVFFLSGELDHHSVRELRNVIDERLTDYRPTQVTLDLSGVTFTDSAGLGLILGRYAKVKDYGGTLSLRNVSPGMMKILRLAGADRLMKLGQTAGAGKKA